MRDYVKSTFIDPYSIRDAQIAPPRPGQMNIPGTFRQESGWIVCMRANAKNRMGGYVGIRDTVLVIRDGRVLGAHSGEPIHYDIRTNCRDAKYERFAEVEEQSPRR